MKQAVLFKALQSQLKFRNPKSLLKIPSEFSISTKMQNEIQKELDQLDQSGVKYTFPGDQLYPLQFHYMKEPPLFLQYVGAPAWLTRDFISVVGSRKSHPLTEEWIFQILGPFLKELEIGLVSGGARGVDQLAHLSALRVCCPNIVVLPSGLGEVYPYDLLEIKDEIINQQGCLISEFNFNQKVHKSFFNFRNRIIAALGNICLVAQAQEKSGTMLTVNHALEIGRPVLTVPAHPLLSDFSGNIKLIQDGAYVVSDLNDLHNFWLAEKWSCHTIKSASSIYGG